MFDSMTYAYHMSYNGIKFIHNFFIFYGLIVWTRLRQLSPGFSFQ